MGSAEMTVKRKRTNSVAQQGQHVKRTKTGALLNQLPIEILNMILDHAVPDPRSMQPFGDPKATMKMYTSPILQVSRLFRSQCISIINKRCLWIRLNFHGDDIFAACSDAHSSLPMIPPEFHYLIPENPAQIVLNLSFDEGGSPEPEARRPKPLNTVWFPLNFDEMLQFCQKISIDADNFVVNSLLFEFENMTDWAWREVSNFISPALSRVHGFEVVDFAPHWIDWHPDLEMPIIFDSDAQEPLFIDLVDVTFTIMRHALKLEDQHLGDEADLFLLYSLWTLTAAEHVLPEPSDWEMGEADPWARIKRQYVELEGRCPQGNELRRALFRIQGQACIAYARLFSKYGPAWCLRHPWSDSIAESLLRDPVYTSFGLEVEEQVQLHSSRALMCDAMRRLVHYEVENRLRSMADAGKYMYDHYTNFAAQKMYFACALQPENKELRTLYEMYRSRVNVEEVDDLESEWKERFITEKVEGSDVIWCGDEKDLEDWGGPEVLQYLPLAQKMPVEKTKEQIDQEMQEVYAILRAQGRPVPGDEEDEEDFSH